MSGETDLHILLGSMSPVLSDETFVFVAAEKGIRELARLEPWALIAEGEGTTVILEKGAADRSGLRYRGAFRRLTLTVHSSLEAVGLTAAVAARLADGGISANVVAAFYHDHIFVQEERALEALRLLEGLAAENRG
jgi:uncharacterized protein